MIVCELDFVYVYKGRKFLTKAEAIRYKELLRLNKNEKELESEWKKQEESKLMRNAWRDS